MEHDGPSSRSPYSSAKRPAARSGRRLLITIAVIVVVAGVLGYFVVDILKTATNAMSGR